MSNSMIAMVVILSCVVFVLSLLLAWALFEILSWSSDVSYRTEVRQSDVPRQVIAQGGNKCAISGNNCAEGRSLSHCPPGAECWWDGGECELCVNPYPEGRFRGEDS